MVTVWKIFTSNKGRMFLIAWFLDSFVVLSIFGYFCNVFKRPGRVFSFRVFRMRSPNCSCLSSCCKQGMLDVMSCLLTLVFTLPTTQQGEISLLWATCVNKQLRGISGTEAGCVEEAHKKSADGLSVTHTIKSPRTDSKKSPPTNFFKGFLKWPAVKRFTPLWVVYVRNTSFKSTCIVAAWEGAEL